MLLTAIFPFLLLFIFSLTATFCDKRIPSVDEESPNNVFIEPIHLLTHNSQPTLEIHLPSTCTRLTSAVNIFYNRSFDMYWCALFTERFLDPYQLLSPAHKERDWPLWCLNSTRIARPLHSQRMLFFTAWPLSIAKSRSIWCYNKRTARKASSCEEVREEAEWEASCKVPSVQRNGSEKDENL